MALRVETAVPNLARTPTAPGPHAQVIVCHPPECDNVLGVVDAGWLFTRHRGRRQTTRAVGNITCERCGRIKTLLGYTGGDSKER